MSDWVAGYVGIPFAPRGASRAGCNCWGLVQLVLREQANLPLPSYGEIDAHDLGIVARAVDAEHAAGLWLEVLPHAARDFDVVKMWGFFADQDGRQRRADLHVGVVVPGRRILHVQDGLDAVAVPIEHGSVASRIRSYYRHRSLA